MLKIKNLDHNFGLNPEAITAAEKRLSNSYYTRAQSTLAFVINRPNGAQVSLEMIRAINYWLKIHPDKEVCVFAVNKDLPICPINTAVYPLNELKQYYGPVVYLDLASFEYGASLVPNPGYFYIADAFFLSQVRQNIPQVKLNEWARQKHIRYITRTKEYGSLIMGMYGWASDDYLPELNVEFFYDKIRNTV
jgi:hypothetical protein